ncbi:hypothetical protein [Capnocytophaga canis]|uniref:Uncharacterized protein n=1 Tax=Capnocytophaga canis TaxID=1848903 RepID=A0A0B7IS19_9FLAO|nr:hypothetical protein [Capnocytophaga canis]CEN52822.1 hypothetical protein CCAND93_300002 [Capnocytophaga canis]
MRLIYHKTDSFEEYSIFDVELITLSYQQNLCLISPYIGTKITMSVTKDFRMPISIGQRYVIWAKSQRNKVGLILPLEFRDLISGYPAAEIDEDYFYDKKKNKEALWVNFGNDVIFYDDHFLFEQWKKAAKVELDRTNYSGYTRAHNPLYYRLVMDLEYRKKILDLCD